jgi:murein DD-endopeptidase MepM/ murein hydrolase activator NlpD
MIWRTARVALALGMVLPLLAACTGGSAPGFFHDDGWRRRQASASAEKGVVTVRKGDNLYQIARRNNAPLRAVIDANNLSPPYNLQPGQKLRIPTPDIHVVRRQETIYGISRKYGYDTSTLASFNRIREPYNIKAGQTLLLPGSAGSRDETATGSISPPPPSIVKPPPQVEVREISADPREPVVASRAPAIVAPAVRRNSGPFQWPIEGSIISAFGAKDGGLHNDGINIKARSGDPVHAAADGLVTYSGNELRGYGNLLLVRHKNGFVTAYAHNSLLNVSKGAQVKKGQVIAKVGDTGNVSESQLHFEIRRGLKAVNPQTYLH